MEELILKNDTLANKISYYHIVFFMASLPFDMFYSHIILISLFIHTLIQLNSKTIKPIFTTRTLILQSVFYVTVLSTIYTINRPEGFNEWGKHLTILLLPVLFCLNPLDLKKYQSRLLLSFGIIITVIIAHLYADALRTIKHYGLPLSKIYSAAFTNHNFSYPIGMHATFFSLQVAIALIYLLSVLLKERSKSNIIFLIICCCILLAGLIQLSSKSVFVALFLTINLAIPYFILQGKKRIRFIAVAASVSALIIAAIFTLSILKVRYIADLKYDLERTTKNETFDSRLDRWNTAAELIKKSPVIGYGAGSELGLLHESFFAKKYYNSFINNLNAHNEYLSFLIKSGIIGLLIYLATLAYGFRQAFRKKDLFLFSFMLLITIVSFSENILDVDKGIIFYAFFFSFFAFAESTTRPVSYPQ